MRKQYLILIFLVFIGCKKDEPKVNSKACFDYSPNDNIKVGDTLTFANCSENAIKYIWDFGDGDTSTLKFPYHTYYSAGNYKVTLSASNESSTDTLMKTIEISPKPDQIVYYKAPTDQKINSVRFFTPSGVPPNIQLCPSIPTPQDSSVSMAIDVDGDAISDFVFEAQHAQVLYFCGSHCVCSYYRISIISKNNTSWISSMLKNNLDYIPIYYDSLEIIKKDSIWKNRAFLYLYSPGAPFSADFSSSYIGIKINDKFGWIKIEPIEGNGVRIIEYAINLTKNNEIKAGQQE